MFYAKTSANFKTRRFRSGILALFFDVQKMLCFVFFVITTAFMTTISSNARSGMQFYRIQRVIENEHKILEKHVYDLAQP